MDKYIFKKKKALDKKICDKIIDLFEKYNPILRREHDYYAIHPSPSINDIHYSSIYSTLRTYLREYGKKHLFLGRRKSWGIDSLFNIQKYNPGQYYDSSTDSPYWKGHCETMVREGDLRCLAWMFYLNDIKHKGGTCWPQQNFTSTPRAGDLYIWPAGWTHSHYGVPALKETKYIVTGWCSFHGVV